MILSLFNMSSGFFVNCDLLGNVNHIQDYKPTPIGILIKQFETVTIPRFEKTLLYSGACLGFLKGGGSNISWFP